MTRLIGKFADPNGTKAMAQVAVKRAHNAHHVAKGPLVTSHKDFSLRALAMRAAAQI
jgi:hypothetical protein